MATMTFGLSGSIINSNKTFSGADSDVTGLLQWGSTVYSSLLPVTPTAAITASISGTVMTVTNVASGGLATNQFIYGTGVAPGTYITTLGTGGGGPGTYNLNVSQVVASGAMKAYGPDIVATALYQGTMNSWIQAQQKFVRDNNLAAVPTPPPMGWT
jgi:hypothetical protein